MASREKIFVQGVGRKVSGGKKSREKIFVQGVSISNGGNVEASPKAYWERWRENHPYGHWGRY